ncbi:MAG: PIN domain-containing protein [Gemmatimonadota bacterium]|nr:PIN domain-containing protein [Gemmatimonadota bacterium]MDH3424709.1 PIN domain-containing protein [Gemmatimonadota bacterium]
MTRVLIDVNVILDVLAEREPFVEDSQAVLQLVEAGIVEGVLAAHSVTTLHYLLSKHLSRGRARKTLEDLLHILRVEAVDEDRVRHALAMNWTDFEDAVQAACAEKAEADYLVTRDKKGFKRSVVRSITPAELVAIVT